MRLQGHFTKRKARIEIVPLIDIIFFLLATFVMVSLSMIQNQGVPVHLPTAATAAPQERQGSVTVTVTKAGEIFLDKEKVNLEDLRTGISRLKANQPELRVFINGDEDASFKGMMQVLDTIRTLGITKVAMQTKPGAAA